MRAPSRHLLALLLALAALLMCASTARATTWNEPWHEDVVRDAESFVLADVISKGDDGVTARVVKQLAGKEMPREFRITGYSMLTLGSYSAGAGSERELALRLKPDHSYYVFLEHKADAAEGEFLIATPTAGWASVGDEGVVATFRISMHQALVPAELYEAAQVALFHRLHGAAPGASSGKDGDEAFVRKLVDEALTKPPVNVGDDDDALFFRQHVALECLRHFGTEKDLPLLEPFLTCGKYHVEISAVRALAGVDAEPVCPRLLEFLKGDGGDFAKVMAVWGVKQRGCKDLLPALKELEKAASEEEIGYGLNIMDPRIGTHLPGSVKEAIAKLVEEWEGA